MEVEQLTENGIERLIKGERVILQVISAEVVDKPQQNQKFILAHLSDGYAYVQRCFFTIYHFPDLNPLHKIVKVKVTELKPDFKNKLPDVGKKRKNMPIPMEHGDDSFDIIREDIKQKIGQPLLYYEFLKNGRVNNNGNRKLPILEKQQQDNSDQQLTNVIQQMKNKHRASKEKQQKNTTNQEKQVKVQKKNTKPANKPIEKIEQRQNRKSIKPEVKHSHQQFTSIKQLFLGIQSFTICGRILFIGPMKTFTNKKGNVSQLLNIQFGDKSGIINCTIFGQVANKYCNLSVDQIYAISGALVTEKQYKGVKQIKLSFTQNTKINRILQQDINLPKAQQFAMSLKDLTEQPKGSVCTLSCYVKQRQKLEFMSKNGNKVNKKILRLFDLENQVESEMTLIGGNAQIEFPQGIYIMKGVEVGEYQGNKQYSGGFTFNSRPIESGHQKKIQNIDELQFVNLSSNQKNKREGVSSFYELLQKCETMQDSESIWSEVSCYLKGIRLGGNAKTTYISCPTCKKKVEEGVRQCFHCNARFDHPIYRYILSINLIDDHSNIWVNCYDDTGSVILADPDEQNFSADRFAAMDQEALRSKINGLRYKRLKVKIVSAKEQFNDQKRLKHKVVKVLPFQPANENKLLLQKIEKMLGNI